MKNKQRLIFPALIILSLAALAMKKFMIPFHSFFLIVVFDGMALFFFMKAFRSEKIPGAVRGRSFNFDLSSIVYGICSISILYRLQYWDSWERWISVATILFLLVTGFTVYSIRLITKVPEWKKNIRTMLVSNLPWVYFIIIFTPVATFNPRTFHNLFNGSTYESFVTTRYSEEEANSLINLYKPTDAKSINQAEIYYEAAAEKEKDEEYEKALYYYNESIDLNPDNAKVIYLRGRLKLTKLEISAEMAQSALGDFSRAIKIDSNMAQAYYHRAVAHNYLYPKNRIPARKDLLKSQELDTTLKNDVFIKNFLAMPMSDDSSDTIVNTANNTDGP